MSLSQNVRRKYARFLPGFQQGTYPDVLDQDGRPGVGFDFRKKKGAGTCQKTDFQTRAPRAETERRGADKQNNVVIYLRSLRLCISARDY